MLHGFNSLQLMTSIEQSFSIFFFLGGGEEKKKKGGELCHPGVNESYNFCLSDNWLLLIDRDRSVGGGTVVEGWQGKGTEEWDK